ncbi:MAG: isoleucine--tRNA ligase [Spirochaetaceae bacterium]|jgi:isoleucyl-tRNA synthetase|nr:isoleucine--tRNA ligase [Spirochaetaceae bacterium]
MYKPVDHAVNFPKLEEEILAFWQEHHIFEQSIAQREGADDFSFYDGPPFATGMPHFGHFVPSTIKDIIPRYKTMRGKRVERRFGWDCHGLPVENLIEKELGLNSKTDIERYGVAAFNEACRKAVLRYVREWRSVITRLGRWVDFDHDYKTMDPDYMETIWWVIKSLWEKELLYEGHYILPYCPRCATVLSNHELNLGGYQDVHDPAITVRFKITGIASGTQAASNPLNASLADGATYLLAWTTTPWTLPSNLALTVGPEIEYALVQDGAERYILASSRLEAYYKDPQDYTVLCRQTGAQLVGITYEPLFPYFADAPSAFRIYAGDFVSTQEGTGIVHTAPGFGEDDQRVLKGSGVPVICPVDAECRFTALVKDYAGVFVKDADKAIIERLKAEGKLVKREQILHAYPHCWRCGHPLIYRAVDSWFVDVQKIKELMLAANEQITWVPEHIKTGRFGKWLSGARDWAISRNRYWGNPLPIWKCPDCKKMICIGSRAELKERSGVEVQDMHKHFVDELTIPCTCGASMRRVPEVLDCWFESGAMPYGQNHYPFENKAFFDAHFPADFINEGLDQTRGWFYTLTILAAALFKKPAFKYCIVSGIVLAADGKKMSKSLNNYSDPLEVINTFGADALRLFLVHSSVVKADDLRYSDEGMREVLKSFLIPLWNAYSFFVTYATIDGIQPSGAPEEAILNPLDQWILSASETLVETVGAALDAYDLSRAVDPLLNFIDLLNNWYIRRSRRRFWKSEHDTDKLQAYQSLYSALKTLITVSAPFMPFITDAIWQNLRLAHEPLSVHLADFPALHKDRRNPALEYRMAAVQHAVSMGRALRSLHGIKVRQPLSTVELITRNAAEKDALLSMEESIREELNVKQVLFRDNEEEVVHYEVKANFRILGKELGKDMQAAAAALETLGHDAIQSLLNGQRLTLTVAGRTVPLTADKVIIRRLEKAGFKVLNEGTLTVALDTQISPELAEEGDIRDLIRGVQNLRKETGFAVSDRIILRVNGSPRLKAAWEHFSSFAAAEVLASEALWGEFSEDAVLINAGEENWRISISKSSQS